MNQSIVLLAAFFLTPQWTVGAEQPPDLPENCPCEWHMGPWGWIPGALFGSHHSYPSIEWNPALGTIPETYRITPLICGAGPQENAPYKAIAIPFKGFDGVVATRRKKINFATNKDQIEVDVDACRYYAVHPFLPGVSYTHWDLHPKGDSQLLNVIYKYSWHLPLGTAGSSVIVFPPPQTAGVGLSSRVYEITYNSAHVRAPVSFPIRMTVNDGIDEGCSGHPTVCEGGDHVLGQPSTMDISVPIVVYPTYVNPDIPFSPLIIPIEDGTRLPPLNTPNDVFMYFDDEFQSNDTGNEFQYTEIQESARIHREQYWSPSAGYSLQSWSICNEPLTGGMIANLAQDKPTSKKQVHAAKTALASLPGPAGAALAEAFSLMSDTDWTVSTDREVQAYPFIQSSLRPLLLRERWVFDGVMVITYHNQAPGGNTQIRAYGRHGYPFSLDPLTLDSLNVEVGFAVRFRHCQTATRCAEIPLTLEN